MPNDMVVDDDTTRVLGEDGEGELAPTRFHVERIGDLAESGLMERSELEVLLSAARDVTSAAIRSVDTYRPRRNIAGTRRPDLGRYPAMLAQTSQVSPEVLNVFWRHVRAMPAPALIRATEASELARKFEVLKWFFGPVVVGSNATLHVTAKHGHLTCGDLTIEAGGRILSTGSTLRIQAMSIKGN